MEACEKIAPLTEKIHSIAAGIEMMRRFMDISTSAAQQEWLPAQQHQALLAIRGHRGEAMTVGKLAERLLIAPHSATELVGRLAAAGYVTRNVDPADRRRQTLLLTDKAAVVLEQLSGIHLTEIRDLAPKLLDILKKLEEGR